MEIEELGKKTIGCAIEVHRELGPGLLENSYEHCLVHELKINGINCERQKLIPIQYKGINIIEGYRIDILVENKIILELKTVEKLNDLHKAQLITYLKMSDLNLGFLLNFNQQVLREGIRRVVYNHVYN